MDKDYFYFKDFALRNRDASLKINTDGVLLAAWAEIEDAISILDIGTSSGVIAFILAYRNSKASIEGIDICENSILEARYNKTINSQLATNVTFLNQSLQEYILECGQTYSHIVCNPPFFDIDKAYSTPVTSKQKAKHSYDLSVDELLQCSSTLMRDRGKLSIIIDYRDLVEIEKSCSENQLYISRKVEISGKPSKEPNRLLIEFTKSKLARETATSSLSIREENGNYTNEYKQLTKDLYLNF